MQRVAPRVSVVMAVRDGADHVGAALTSVLTQTLTDLELIAVDDGSTDATPDVLRNLADDRLRVVAQDRNGLVPALNRGVGLARAPYVARMDADDTSLPERLAIQARFLDEHPDVVLVGSSFEIANDDDGRVRVEPALVDDDDLRREMLIRNPFAHGSVVMRKDAVETLGGYHESYPAAEDFDLWRRLAEVGRLANVPFVLYRWRQAVTGVTSTRAAVQADSTRQILAQEWARTGVPQPLGRAEIGRRARRYRAVAAPLGNALEGRFYQVHLALAIQLLRRRHVRAGARQLLAVSGSGIDAVPATLVFAASGGRVASLHDVRRRLARHR